MSRRTLWRLGVVVQFVALIAIVVVGIWWFSMSRAPAAPAESGDPTVTAFVKSVKDSLATEQARGTPTTR
jgi:hypothetical protein